jgi:hypothetical protein
VFDCIHKIVNYPTAWPLIDEDVRRCLVNRFPFGVIYSIEQSGVFILAVMHLRRHPDYLKIDIEMVGDKYHGHINSGTSYETSAVDFSINQIPGIHGIGIPDLGRFQHGTGEIGCEAVGRYVAEITV